MLILVAAGNDGLKQGTVTGTVGSPATAKNILAVGASQTTTQGWLDSTEYTNWQEKRLSAASQLGVSPATFDCCAASNQAVVKEYCCEGEETEQRRSLVLGPERRVGRQQPAASLLLRRRLLQPLIPLLPSAPLSCCFSRSRVITFADYVKQNIQRRPDRYGDGVTYSIILFHLRAFALARTCLFAP